MLGLSSIKPDAVSRWSCSLRWRSWWQVGRYVFIDSPRGVPVEDHPVQIPPQPVRAVPASMSTKDSPFRLQSPNGPASILTPCSIIVPEHPYSPSRLLDNVATIPLFVQCAAGSTSLLARDTFTPGAGSAALGIAAPHQWAAPTPRPASPCPLALCPSPCAAVTKVRFLPP